MLLSLIRVDGTGRDRFRELLHVDPDWEALVSLAARHGLLPLLYHNTYTMGRKLVAPSVLSELQPYYLENSTRNMRLVHLMVRVFDLFSAAGIACIPMKGPTLAQRLYGDTSLRTFVDLDILIHSADFPRGYDILIEDGFAPKCILSPREQGWLLRGDTEYEFFYQGDMLELHWDIAEKGIQAPLKTDIFWGDLQATEFQGRQIDLLSADNLFWLLCIHGAKHGWRRLCWLADLARFVQAYPDRDWLGLLDQSRRLGFSRVVCLGLVLVESFCGVYFPPDVRQACRSDPYIDSLAKDVARAVQGDDLLAGFGWMKFYLGTRERLRDRLHFIVDQVFFPKQVDWRSLPLPGVLYPLYYLYRPARLARKFTPGLIRSRRTPS